MTVQGLKSADMLKELAKVFNIHEMALDTIVNTPGRVKTHVYPDTNQALLVTRMLAEPSSVSLPLCLCVFSCFVFLQSRDRVFVSPVSCLIVSVVRC